MLDAAKIKTLIIYTRYIYSEYVYIKADCMHAAGSFYIYIYNT